MLIQNSFIVLVYSLNIAEYKVLMNVPANTVEFSIRIRVIMV